MHFAESEALKMISATSCYLIRIPVNGHPALVPCTSDTRLYQKHVYFTALIDQVKYCTTFLVETVCSILDINIQCIIYLYQFLTF